jgi:hypothetical protein
VTGPCDWPMLPDFNRFRILIEIYLDPLIHPRH